MSTKCESEMMMIGKEHDVTSLSLTRSFQHFSLSLSLSVISLYVSFIIYSYTLLFCKLLQLISFVIESCRNSMSFLSYSSINAFAFTFI